MGSSGAIVATEDAGIEQSQLCQQTTDHVSIHLNVSVTLRVHYPG